MTNYSGPHTEVRNCSWLRVRTAGRCKLTINHDSQVSLDATLSI